MFRNLAALLGIFCLGTVSAMAGAVQPERTTSQGVHYNPRLRSWMLPDGQPCTSDREADDMLIGRSRGDVTYLIGAPEIPESLKGWARSEYILKTSVWKYRGKPICDESTGYMTDQIIIYFDGDGAVNNVQFL